MSNESSKDMQQSSLDNGALSLAEVGTSTAFGIAAGITGVYTESIFSLPLIGGASVSLGTAWYVCKDNLSAIRTSLSSFVLASAISLTSYIQFQQGEDNARVDNVIPYKTESSSGVIIQERGGDKNAYIFNGEDNPYTPWKSYKRTRNNEIRDESDNKKLNLEQSLQAQEDRIFSTNQE